MPAHRLFPPPLTMFHRVVVSCLPTATNSGTDLLCTSAVGIRSISSLWSMIKGMPLRGGCFPPSSFESWNRLCCASGFKGCLVSVIRMGTHMIIGNICEFLHCLVQTFLSSKFIQVRAFILQRVEVPLHGRIVIRIPGFAHALYDMSLLAEFDECFGSVL